MSQDVASDGNGKGLAAVVLAGGGNQTAAAEAAHVDRQTVGRWLKADPDFTAQIRELRRAAYDEAVSLLNAEAVEAARALIKLATGQHSNANARLGSIRTLFQIAGEHFVLTDIEERLSALEMRSLH